jgi:hypothetical protein
MRIPYARVGAALLVAAGISVTACGTMLGLGDYAVKREVDAGTTIVDAAAADDDALVDVGTRDGVDAGSAADSAADSSACDVDLATQCYACAPTTSLQIVNACTGSTCVPFDDGVRLTNLLGDGALPPVPVKDGSAN